MFIAAVAESFHQIYEALVLVGWPGYRGSLCVSVALSLVASVMLVLITMQGGRLGAIRPIPTSDERPFRRRPCRESSLSPVVLICRCVSFCKIRRPVDMHALRPVKY